MLLSSAIVHAAASSMPLLVSPDCLNLLFQGGKSGLGSVKDQGILTLFTRISGTQIGLDEYFMVGIKQKRKGVLPLASST